MLRLHLQYITFGLLQEYIYKTCTIRNVAAARSVIAYNSSISEVRAPIVLLCTLEASLVFGLHMGSSAKLEKPYSHDEKTAECWL